MYFGFLSILVALSTQQVIYGAVTPIQSPTQSVSEDLLRTQNEYKVESLTSPYEIADNPISSGRITSFDSESTSSSSASDESIDQLFQFVHDADIKTDEDFSQLVRDLETTTEQQYKEALKELEQWSSIPVLSEYREETAEGLKIAKNQLSQATANAEANILNQLQNVKKAEGPENLRKCIKQKRKVFEIEIMPKLQYYIDALSAIKAIGQERMRSEYGQSTRSLQLTRSTPQMGANTIENTYSSMSSSGQDKFSETIAYDTELNTRMRRGEPVTSTTGMNTSMKNSPPPTKIGTPMQTGSQRTGIEEVSGSVRSTSRTGSGIINEGLGFGNEITRTGLSAGNDMTGKTLSYGNEMTESISKFGENTATNVKSGSRKMKGMSDDIYSTGERVNYVSNSGRRDRDVSWDSSSMEDDSWEHHGPPHKHHGPPHKHHKHHGPPHKHHKHHGPPHKHHGPHKKHGPRGRHGSHEKYSEESEEEYVNRRTYEDSDFKAGISEFEGMSTRTYSPPNGNGKITSTSGIKNY